ncbi:hypothetical protein ACFSZS_05960 [Seohaeicola zhoushanensis]
MNAASRLEAMTKEMAVEALVSAELLAGAGIDLSALTLVTLELRGVAEPVPALPLRHAVEIDELLQASSETA